MRVHACKWHIIISCGHVNNIIYTKLVISWPAVLNLYSLNNSYMTRVTRMSRVKGLANNRGAFGRVDCLSSLTSGPRRTRMEPLTLMNSRSCLKLLLLGRYLLISFNPEVLLIGQIIYSLTENVL